MTEPPARPGDETPEAGTDAAAGAPPSQWAAGPPAPGGYPPYQYPPGYPPPYPGYAAPAPRNGLGVAALAIALVALLTAFWVVPGALLGIVAVVMGFLGRGRVSRGEATNSGVATAGVVIGILAIVASIVAAVFLFLVFRTAGGDDYVRCLREAGSDQAAQQRCADQFREHLEDTYGPR